MLSVEDFRDEVMLQIIFVRKKIANFIFDTYTVEVGHLEDYIQ